MGTGVCGGAGGALMEQQCWKSNVQRSRFWKSCEPGAQRRFCFQGELGQVVERGQVSNALCLSPQEGEPGSRDVFLVH